MFEASDDLPPVHLHLSTWQFIALDHELVQHIAVELCLSPAQAHDLLPGLDALVAHVLDLNVAESCRVCICGHHVG